MYAVSAVGFNNERRVSQSGVVYNIFRHFHKKFFLKYLFFYKIFLLQYKLF